MICQICKKKFYIKRTFLSLFDTKTKFICDRCYGNNPISLNIEMIMLDNGQIRVVSLFDNIYKIDIRPYVYEINQVYSYFHKEYKGYTILLLDYLYVTYFNLEVLSFWNEVFDKKVLIICGVLRK